MVAKPDKRSREHAESYKRRKNESILQMIQTLEISSTSLTPDNAHPLRPSKKQRLSFHRPTHLKPSLIKSDISTCSDTVAESEYCNDNDTFISALCGSSDISTSDVDTIEACNEPFETGIAASPIVKQPRITTRRQRRTYDTTFCNYSDFCNNGLSQQIESMVLEVESVYANRHTEERKPSSVDYLPADYLSVEEVQEVSADKTPEIIKDHAPITPTNILLRDKFKPINDTSGDIRYAE